MSIIGLYMQCMLLLLAVLCVMELRAELQGSARAGSLLNELTSPKEDTNKESVLVALSYGHYPVRIDEWKKFGQVRLELATKLSCRKGILLGCGILGYNFESKSDY